MGVNFLNISQYGNPNFRVGDEWQMTATGLPGETVYVYATLNGVSIGGGPQGTIDANGQLVIAGTMDRHQAGIWSEQWAVGSSPAGTYNFLVVGLDE